MTGQAQAAPCLLAGCTAKEPGVVVITVPLDWLGLLPESHACGRGLTRVGAELTCSRWFVSRFLGQLHAHRQRSPQYCALTRFLWQRTCQALCIPSKPRAVSNICNLQVRWHLCFPKGCFSRCCCSLDFGGGKGGSGPVPRPPQCLCSHSVRLRQLFPTVARQVPHSAGSAQGPFRVGVPLCRFSDLRLILALGPR